MAFTTFIGRALFASVFILSAYQEFTEIEIAGKTLKPKVNDFANHVLLSTGLQLPDVEAKHLVASAVALKGLGGILFIYGSSFGAFLLILHQLIAIPVLYDFYNYDSEAKEFNQLFIKFTQNLALFGALLFFIGTKNSIPRRQHKRKVHKTKNN